jgi:transposase
VATKLQQVLEGGNLKLGDVATDILGVSGRAILSAIASGAEQPEGLAELAKGKLRNKRPELAQALVGSVGSHQRFMIERLLKQIDFLEQEIAVLDKEVDARTEGRFRVAVNLIDQIPGIGQRVGEQILAELGLDMSQFPTAAACASWVKICPGTYRSASTFKPVGTGKGNRWLRHALIEAAKSAIRTQDCYYASLYKRIAKRRGANKATVAIAHALLVTIYTMLKNGTAYQELGADHLDDIDRERLKRSALRRLETLGFQVSELVDLKQVA